MIEVHAAINRSISAIEAFWACWLPALYAEHSILYGTYRIHCQSGATWELFSLHATGLSVRSDARALACTFHFHNIAHKDLVHCVKGRCARRCLKSDLQSISTAWTAIPIRTAVSLPTFPFRPSQSSPVESALATEDSKSATARGHRSDATQIRPVMAEIMEFVPSLEQEAFAFRCNSHHNSENAVAQRFNLRNYKPMPRRSQPIGQARNKNGGLLADPPGELYGGHGGLLSPYVWLILPSTELESISGPLTTGVECISHRKTEYTFTTRVKNVIDTNKDKNTLPLIEDNLPRKHIPASLHSALWCRAPSHRYFCTTKIGPSVSTQILIPLVEVKHLRQ
ncbi:hypothetical protein BKA70DRAFT_1482515 [Coprinopsis sp. MPI-PUGE-AT-0042]|nr:hypothetical protein BKA70DRAFT_1482515 [Coprinopsis sp. MPI-PUGE-AT-0042]